MRLIGPNGATLRLEILGYQFPGITDEPTDANWLRVRGAVSCDRGAWSFHSSCLMADELLRLATWLRGVRARSLVTQENQLVRVLGKGLVLDFTEPELRFETSDQRSVEVTFAHEAAPPWEPHEEFLFRGFRLSFPVELNDLDAAAASLESMSQAFPSRGSPRLGD